MIGIPLARRVSGSYGTAFGVTIAGAAVALWLWTNFCGFPWSVWNDVRLAPVFMAALGEQVYTLPGDGVVTTWMYGPVPLWLWWPATWADDVVSAVLAAGALNTLYTVTAVAIACAGWPVPDARPIGRAFAFLFCLACWPYASFHYLQPDNLAVAAALVANTWLVRSAAGGAATLWTIALLTAAALGCKQTSLGLLVAQFIWLSGARGAAVAWRHAFRTFAVATLIAGIAALRFGGAELWFGMLEVPRRLPWVAAPVQRLWELRFELAVSFGLPAALLLWRGRAWLRSNHPLQLPLLTWLCSLPLGLLALLTIGGNVNSLQGFVMLAPPLVLAAVTAVIRRPWVQSALAALVVAVIALRWNAVPDRPLRPLTLRLEQATEFCRQHPGRIWFPWNPTVTYFAEHRFYHAEDGLYVRRITGYPVSPEQLRRSLPPQVRWVAVDAPSWELALGFTSRVEQRWGVWRVYEWTGVSAAATGQPARR